MRKRYIYTLVALTIYLKAAIALADGYKVIQITNNDYPDVGVEIYGSKLTWQARPKPEDSSATQIFFYDGKDSIQLTDSDTYKCTPSISSGGIVWQEYSKGSGTKVFFKISLGRKKVWYKYPAHAPSNIFFYNFKNIKCLTSDFKGDFFRPAIYDDKIVWCKQRKIDGQIMMYDGSHTKTVKGAYGIFPRISSGGVMYSNVLNGRLYLYNWNEIIELGDVDVEYTRHPHNQQINQDKLVWRKYINGYHEVFLHDISTGITKQITNKEVSSMSNTINRPTGGEIDLVPPWALLASVSGEYVAWINRKDDMNYLRLYDGNKILTITSAHLIDEPFFGDGFLVWAAGSNTDDTEIFIYNLKTKEIEQITNDDYKDRYPVASRDYIAWQKYDGNDWEIYLAEREDE